MSLTASKPCLPDPPLRCGTRAQITVKQRPVANGTGENRCGLPIDLVSTWGFGHGGSLLYRDACSDSVIQCSRRESTSVVVSYAGPEM